MTVEIPVVVEQVSVPPMPSMNVEPIMHEVRHALERLVQHDETTVIDLRALPLAPGEDDTIKNHLGIGETTIRIDALGPSTLTETSIPGVWWVEHRNNDETLTGLYIEIAKVPSIVAPHDMDLKEGLTRLDDYLEEMIDHD